MSTTVPQSLPSPEEVELADYKLASFTSDLDAIKSAVEKAMEGVSLGDYVFMRDAGIRPDEREPVDHDALFRLIVFAGELIHDAESIREQASELHRTLLAEVHEAWSEEQRGPEQWRAYCGRIRGWHAEEAARDDG